MVDLDKDEMDQVKKFGHSFGSKLVAQGPTFFNIRTMCECFGRALAKHIQFSEEDGEALWFLDEKLK